jgi:hypothetical protein
MPDGTEALVTFKEVSARRYGDGGTAIAGVAFH